MVHLLPEDVGIDDVNVQHTPEDVFPPPPASTAQTVVGPKLVHPVDTTDQGVIPSDTAWSWHDAVVIRPIDGLAWLWVL